MERKRRSNTHRQRAFLRQRVLYCRGSQLFYCRRPSASRCCAVAVRSKAYLRRQQTYAKSVYCFTRGLEGYIHCRGYIPLCHSPLRGGDGLPRRLRSFGRLLRHGILIAESPADLCFHAWRLSGKRLLMEKSELLKKRRKKETGEPGPVQTGDVRKRPSRRRRISALHFVDARSCSAPLTGWPACGNDSMTARELRRRPDRQILQTLMRTAAPRGK